MKKKVWLALAGVAGAVVCAALVKSETEPNFAVKHTAGGKKQEKFYISNYKRLEGVVNLSGVTYNEDKNCFVAISNGPTVLYELSKSGEILRSIYLKGFHDTEDIAYIGDGKYYIIEERKYLAHLIELNEKSSEISRSEVLKTIKLPRNSTSHNKGPEGISYDAANSAVLVGEEGTVDQLLQYSNNKHDIISLKRHVYRKIDDISAVYYDNKEKKTMILSDESCSILEVDRNGELTSETDLSGLNNWWRRLLPQPEGMTFTAGDDIFVVSEPNIFCVLSPVRDL